MISFKIILGLAVALCYSDIFIQCDKYIEMLNVETNATNPDVIKADMKYTKFNQTTFTLSGQLIIGTDLDDTTIVSGLIYYSTFGNDVYQLTPYGCPPSKLTEFMNGMYKNLGQQTFRKCSDMITVDDELFVAPFPKNVYTLKDCLFDMEVPQAMSNGHYRTDILVRYNDDVYGMFFYWKVLQ